MRLPPNRCAFACCPPYGQGLDRGRPCEHCRKAHELAMDESYAEHLLEVLHRPSFRNVLGMLARKLNMWLRLNKR